MKPSNGHLSHSMAREAFSKIRVNLEFLNAAKRVKRIMITSALSSEGKSFVSANLARNLAASDKRVLVVDADLRHPSQHKYFSIPNRGGLSMLLAGESDLYRAMVHTDLPGLDVICAGRTPPNPAELLASRRMQQLLEEAAGYYDYVIVDTPPVLLVPDAVALSRYTDGTLLVVRWHYATLQSVEEARDALKLAGVRVLGAIMNDVKEKRGKRGYDYRYYRSTAAGGDGERKEKAP